MASVAKDHEKKEFTLPELIVTKRDRCALSTEQIESFVRQVAHGDVDRSQIGAMLMAMYLNGLNEDETVAMTRTMMNSGETLSWPEEWKHLMVDKHSTGGVGDKVSLPLAPALAACGLKVPMISGRGLAHTGGTLDKLESIPGYKVEVPTEKMYEQIAKVGCCIVGQTKNLVPADKILYAIRDVTGTVQCDALIVASIISKKAAEGLHSLVLDIKCGRAGFRQTLDGAKKLAQSLVDTAAQLGMDTTAVITDMNDPIGENVGNSLEVAESIQCLHGQGPEDLHQIVCDMGSQLLVSAKQAESLEQGADRIREVLKNGKALEKFQQMLVCQGVEEEVAKKLCTPGVDVFTILPRAPNQTTLNTTKPGKVKSVDSLELARVLCELGSGRTAPGQPIDYGVGAKVHVRTGQHVDFDSAWCTVYHNGTLTDSQRQRLNDAIQVDNVPEGTLKTRVLQVVRASTKTRKVFVCQ